MEFRILGPVEVVDGTGRPVGLGGARERALLGRLLLSANRVVSADQLAEDLWAGDPPAQSLGTLRVYISRLRRTLGPAGQALVTQQPGYRLNVAPDQLDATRFAHLADLGRADLAAGRAEAAASGLRRALELWRGPALAEFAGHAFAQTEIIHLEEARLTALEDRIEADLRCGRHHAVAGELDALVKAHPLRERLWAQRMTALYRCGRQAAALQAFHDVRATLREDLGIDPGTELKRLEEAILRQDAQLDWHPAQPPAGLPIETTSFVGREGELATVEEILRLSRLLTLTGPSGSGKSRLARRAGAQALARYPDGVRLVELARITEPDLVIPAAAGALSVKEEPGRPLLDSITAALRTRQALLIVDNCEHVLAGAAGLVTAILRTCPLVRVLATSQHRLGVAGEASWPVPPLTLPGAAERDPQAVGETEAGRLFCERAVLIRAGFALTADNAGPVAEICRRLDGIPLAIELAAARLNTLTPRQLAARLDDRFRLLTGGTRTDLPRHQTLRAALEWSHDLLSEAEQVCLRRMAIFAGGCTIDAAEAVCSGHGLPPHLVLDTVSSLVDRSLLTTQELCATMRYGMLESVHQYARERLDAAAETAGLGHRHSAWLPGLASQADLEGAGQGEWLELLEAEHDNFRAGLARSLAAGDVAASLALAGALAPFWAIRGHISEGRGWLDAALDTTLGTAFGPAPATTAPGAAGSAPDAAASPATAAETTSANGTQHGAAPGTQPEASGGTGTDARTDRQAATPRAAAGAAPGAPGAQNRPDGRFLRATALDGAGRLASVHGDLAAQRRYQEESLAIWRALGDDMHAARCLGDLGMIAHIQGDYPRAQALHTENLRTARRAGDVRQTGMALSGLGQLALHRGELAQATAYYEESMARFREAGDLRRVTLILGNLGVVARNQGDFTLARSRLEEHLSNARTLGDRKLTGGALTNLGLVAQDLGDLDRAAELHREAMTVAEQLGDRRLIVVALTNLGLVARARQDYPAARSCHRRALEVAQILGERRSIAEGLEELAGVYADEGRAAAAAELFGAAHGLREAIGAPIPAADLPRYDHAVQRARAALGEPGFGRAWASGQARPIDDAITFARDDRQDPGTAAGPGTAGPDAAGPDAAAGRADAAGPRVTGHA